jgi:antitoxin component YwqK of YwqJK toxin-antitoxin module
METLNLDQLRRGEGGTYLHGDTPFSGFAIETFPDGSLQTQMILMRGVLDGVARRWHPNGQLESEKSFRNGAQHGYHREWQADGLLAMLSTWNKGAPIEEWRFDDQGRPIQKTTFALLNQPPPVTYQYDESGAAE